MTFKVEDIVAVGADTFNTYKVIYVDGEYIYLVEALMGKRAHRVNSTNVSLIKRG